MKKSKSEIVLSLIDYYDKGNKAQFAKRLGVTAQSVSAWISRSTFDVDLIYTKCEEISGDWLLSGEGPMLKSERVSNVNLDKQLVDVCKRLVGVCEQKDIIMEQLAGLIKSMEG